LKLRKDETARASVILVAILCGCGAPPPKLPWNVGETVIAPGPPTTTGRLVVETAETGVLDDAGKALHAPYYVYDSRGNYLEDVPNDHFTPFALPIGRYLLVTRVAGELRRVQIRIQEGLTTYVLQTDFRTRASAQ